MAHQIDELSLKIDIEGAKKQTANNIQDIATAIRSLNNAVGKSGALANLKAYSNSLQKMAVSIREAFKDVGKSAAANLGKTITPPTMEVNNAPMEGGSFAKYQTSAEDAAHSIGTLKQSIESLRISSVATFQSFDLIDEDVNAVSRFDYAIKKLDGSFNMSHEDARALASRFGEIADEADNAGKKADKSSSFWSKFTKSIGRIAMYRAIRRAIQMVTQAMVEGVQNYAKYSDEANQAISNIKNSFQQVKDSFGVTLGYLVQAFEPVITALSDGVVQLAENINMALASMSGKSTYSRAIKQNEDYAKSLDKVNSKLLSFDKFESLNNDKQGSETRYEEVELDDTLSETAQVLKNVFDIVSQLWAALKPILETALKMIIKILPIIAKIIDWTKKGIDFLEEIGALEPVLWTVAAVLAVIALTNPFIAIVVAITAVIAVIGVLKEHWQEIVDWFEQTIQSIKDWFARLGAGIKAIFISIEQFFIDLWHNIANGFASMINGIVNGFIKFVNIMIDGLNIIIKPLDLIAGIFGGQVKIPHWQAQLNWKPYAEGGIPKVGTMFLAGEAGAEIVSTSRSGQTGVANVEQISQAFLQALINYNAAQNGQGGVGNVYLDGSRVGQLVESGVYSEGVRVGHFKRA